MYPRLKDLREDRDLTQKELAAYLKVSQTTYSRYESGKLDIPSQTIIRLARYFRVTTDYLLGVSSEKRGS